MLRSLATAAAISALVFTVAPSTADACGDEDKAMEAKKTSPGELTAEQLASMIKAKKAAKAKQQAAVVTVLDVNSDEVREQHGKILGAVELTSHDAYALTELPANKDGKLVFYCSTTRCGASKTAAKRALQAGYSDVNVLPVGIMGWTEKGLAVEKAKQNS